MTMFNPSINPSANPSFSSLQGVFSNLSQMTDSLFFTDSMQNDLGVKDLVFDLKKASLPSKSLDNTSAAVNRFNQFVQQVSEQDPAAIEFIFNDQDFRKKKEKNDDISDHIMTQLDAFCSELSMYQLKKGGFSHSLDMSSNTSSQHVVKKGKKSLFAILNKLVDQYSGPQGKLNLIQEILSRGIQDPKDIKKMLSLMVGLEGELSPKLLSEIQEAIQTFLETEASQTTDLSNFMVILKLVSELGQNQISIDRQSVETAIEENFSNSEDIDPKQAELLASQAGFTIDLGNDQDLDQDFNQSPIKPSPLQPAQVQILSPLSLGNVGLKDRFSDENASVESVLHQFLDRQKPKAISEMTQFIQKYLEFKLGKAMDTFQQPSSSMPAKSSSSLPSMPSLPDFNTGLLI